MGTLFWTLVRLHDILVVSTQTDHCRTPPCTGALTSLWECNLSPLALGHLHTFSSCHLGCLSLPQLVSSPFSLELLMMIWCFLMFNPSMTSCHDSRMLGCEILQGLLVHGIVRILVLDWYSRSRKLQYGFCLIVSCHDDEREEMTCQPASTKFLKGFKGSQP